jgi:signal transduction histidine kinase/CheY-like chemotaxis protein
MIAALVLVSIYAALATMVGILLFKELSACQRSRLDYRNMIQKKTCALCFDVKGYLRSDLDSSNCEHAIKGLRTNQNIKDYNGRIKDLNNYFNMCIKYKRTITYKLEETKSGNIVKRTDLIFSPFISNGVLTGVTVISQIIHSNNREAELLAKAMKLSEKNEVAQTQIDKLDAERIELESAFKKSSQHHIKLQKAMYRIEQQKQELENALGIINHQKEDLEKMNAEIARSNHMKDVFLANTSHEIRTPLNAIIGFTNLLLKMEPDAKQFKYLENIKNAGNSLLFIINDILDLSKIEAGKIQLENIRFNMRELIETCVNTVSVKRDNKEITVDIDINENVPEFVKGDPYRINQVLTNLINNAIKFTGSDCQIQLKVNTISSGDGKIELGFSVADNGIGIPKEKLSDIFQSFTQANEDTTRKYGGTGLGLSITKELIEMYGGKIEVESELNKGATFRFNLILEETEQVENESVDIEKTHAQQLAADNANLTALAPLHILLVEDNPINQQLAIDTLKSWNSNAVIDIAGNGQIAVEKVVNILYDVVLMDIQMPVMDGNSATQAIRRLDSPNGKVPIIAMTAHAFKEERDRCMNSGMDDYIMKPFDPDELYGKICKYAGVQIEPASRPEPVAYSASGEGVGDGFDLSPLIEICSGGISELNDIINVYTEYVPADIKELTAAAADGNIEQIRMKIHSLITAFGYMGMATAKELTLSIKDVALEGKNIDELIGSLTQLWDSTLPKIKEFVKKRM